MKETENLDKQGEWSYARNLFVYIDNVRRADMVANAFNKNGVLLSRGLCVFYSCINCTALELDCR